MIIKSDYRLDSIVSGYSVLLRNKHLNDAEHLSPEHPVLFVHGATYGSTHTFDYPVEGQSWMDRMASEGFDVWCIDLLGYGASDRPDVMRLAPEENEPIVDTAHAVQEVNRAVDFILAERGVGRLSLIGYSWGSAITGTFAGQYPEKVERLVLSGALWVREGSQARTIADSPGAYRTVTVDAAIERWSVGLSQEEIDAIVPPDRVRQWAQAVVLGDPDSAEFDPPRLKAPTGVLKDFQHCSSTGEPWYDPGLIQAPTLIVLGELDRETTPAQGREIFSRLTNAANKRMTIIGNGTHTILLENHRTQLQDVVSEFLV